MIKEIIVVEGKDDTAAIRRAVDADTIETGGSAINAQVLRQIVLAQNRRGVIIFTDPDHAGERIRKIVARHVPGCKHAFIAREKAERKGKIGIEHAAPDDIRQALANVRTEHQNDEPEISWNDLLDNGLITDAMAAGRRKAMGEILGLGYANGKQFYKRCAMFRITREEFQRALQQLAAGTRPES